MGLTFPNRVGLAAGMDKNAEAYTSFGAMGFGFVEVGTITPLPQPGNDKPRLFRLPADEALINRMGFNNDGAIAVAQRLKVRHTSAIIGGNIGKNKNTPNDRAVEDYVFSFNALYQYVDYFVVNVSSPNTPDLRALQDKEPLMHILSTLQQHRKTKDTYKPLLLKIAPDLSHAQLDDILYITNTLHLDGLVATNTTVSRALLSTPQHEIDAIGAGGVSGKPLKDTSTSIIQYLRQRTTVPIIGVGGIASVDDAREKINAGADLVQLYTGFIYKGPQLIEDIAYL